MVALIGSDETNLDIEFAPEHLLDTYRFLGDAYYVRTKFLSGDYAKVAEGLGGYSEKVENPADNVHIYYI